MTSRRKKKKKCLTSVHNQTTLLCLFFISPVIGQQNHFQWATIGHFSQVIGVPLSSDTDGSIITIISTFPLLSFNECLPLIKENYETDAFKNVFKLNQKHVMKVLLRQASQDVLPVMLIGEGVEVLILLMNSILDSFVDRGAPVPDLL